MNERDDDADFTARVLDGAEVLDGTLAASGRAGERAEIERAAQEFRLALRNTDVAGLDASMREAILRRAERRSRVRTWPLLVAAAMGGAVVAVLAFYLGVMVPAQQAEAARLEQQRMAEERVAAERERLAEERIRTAQREAEYAKQAEYAKRAAALAAQQAWVDATNAREVEEARPAAGGGGLPDGMSGRAAKSAGGGKVRAGAAARPAGGGCDPNDPLCGL